MKSRVKAREPMSEEKNIVCKVSSVQLSTFKDLHNFSSSKSDDDLFVLA